MDLLHIHIQYPFSKKWNNIATNLPQIVIIAVVMNIAFFHELPFGGARIAVDEIAQNLSQKNRIDLYYTDERRETSNEIYNKKFFYKFTPKKWSGKQWKIRLFKDTIELYKLRNLHKEIAHAIDRKKYDFVFVNASKYIEAPFILSFLKTKTIFYLHDPHFRVLYENELKLSKKIGIIRYIYEYVHRKLLMVLDTQNFKSAGIILANSYYTSKQANFSYGKKSKVMYLGVDTGIFKPGYDARPIDVLYIGSRDILDGYRYFKDATKEIDNKVKIVEVLKDDKWLERNKIAQLMRKSKIVLCLGINEPFGLISIEAMASGAVVIAFNEAGYKETITNNVNGFLVKRSTSMLRDKISEVVNNKTLQKRISKTARENVVKNWDWKVRIKEIEREFKKYV